MLSGEPHAKLPNAAAAWTTRSPSLATYVADGDACVWAVVDMCVARISTSFGTAPALEYWCGVEIGVSLWTTGA
jgi:hypothetical protein